MKTLYFWLLLVPVTVFAADSSHLRSTLAFTENWLRASGTEQEAGWKKFLRWDDLTTEIAKPRPSVAELKLILNRWRKNKVGLENQNFLITQQALRAFIKQAEIEALPDRRGACDGWRQSLSTKPASQGEALEKGKASGWLSLACGDSVSSQSLLSAYAQPNARFSVSARTIAMGLEGMEIHNEQFSTNTIQGVNTSGTVYTDGKISVAPANSWMAGTGIVEVTLDATIHSPRNDGDKGNVHIVSSSSGMARAVAQLALEETGIRVASATGWAAMGTQLLDVYAPSRIVNWLAWRVAERRQGDAAWEASQLAASSLRNQFAGQLNEKIRAASNTYLEPAKQMLRFEAAYPKHVGFSSTPGALAMSITEQNAFQLAANSEPPPLTGKHDLAFAVHESFASNYLAPYMGGKQEWDQALYDIHKLLTTEEPTELRVHDNAPHWYFWVDEYRPMTTDYVGNTLLFRFYGTSIGEVWKGTELSNERPFEVGVNYSPEINVERNQARLRRLGEVTFRYLDSAELTPVDEKLAKMLTRKVNAFFPELFEFGGLTLPKGSGWEKLRRFKLREFKSATGWMNMGFELTNP